MKPAYSKFLAEISDKLDVLKDELQVIVDELQSDFDDKSEKWQEDEAGQEAQADIERVQNASDNLDTIANDLRFEL